MSPYPDNQDLALPSYNEAITAPRINNQFHVQNDVQSEIHDELQHLAIRFSAIRSVKLRQLQQDDERVLDLLIPQIRSFLVEYSESTLPTATLILIPAGSISPLAVPADDDLRSEDDFGRVLTIAHEKGGASPVWDGADMVERLASYLRPKSEELPSRPKRLSSSPVKVASSKKSSWWKRSATTPPTAPPVDVKGVELPKIAMDVKAEEVVFRAESKLGLYENQTVWGIVIKIRVTAWNPGY